MNDHRYTDGIRLFQRREWFECHEVLELLWRDTPAGTTRTYLQGLIQLAVSLEHWRRGNPRGAWGQWEKARAKLEMLPPVYEGLEIAALLDEFRALWACVDLPNAVSRQLSGGGVQSEAAAQTAWPTPRWARSEP